MRKQRISKLLIITLLFAAFTLGFFLGNQQNHPGITVSVPEEYLEAPTAAPEPVSTPTEETIGISFPISINEAEKEEFMALPGIGEVLAERILDYRRENGAFSSPEDLLNVEGIGKKRLEEILEFITIGG